MKFSISLAVFEKLPTACFGVVAVLDAVPSPEADTAIAARLAQAVTDCQAALAGRCPQGIPGDPALSGGLPCPGTEPQQIPLFH